MGGIFVGERGGALGLGKEYGLVQVHGRSPHGWLSFNFQIEKRGTIFLVKGNFLFGMMVFIVIVFG